MHMNINTDRSFSAITRGLFFAIFFATGFSALIYQLVWQRVITLHAGVDLYSVTTVVAAFMAGLGLGSLVGGYIADRLSFRKCFIVFCSANFVIGIFGYFSLWLFYDVYSSLISYINNTASSFLFHYILMFIPTTFMGMSLPLLSRALVRTNDEMASLIGSLYGINTLGAAIGAGLGTWYVLGTFGFANSIYIASSINIGCGILVIIILLKLNATAFSTLSSSEKNLDSGMINDLKMDKLQMIKPWVWITIYGITGFVALSFEIVWFRILDVSYHANSYSFGHILFIYLSCFGAGCLFSSRRINRIKRPDKLFLWMQCFIGLSSILCPSILIILSKFKYSMPGLMMSISEFSFFNAKDYFVLIYRTIVYPFLIFGVPVVLMGACFPLVQRIVSRQINTIGRSLSKLLFSNILGNIIGSLVTGFFLIDLLGTPLTLMFLCSLLILPGVIAAYYSGNNVRIFHAIASVIIISTYVGIMFQNENRFWAFFHSSSPYLFSYAEDRVSVSALRKKKKGYTLLLNGYAHSWFPYGGNIHSILGIAPSLYHADPKNALIIGFGSGETLYAMSLDGRLNDIVCIELSGSQLELLKNMTEREDFEQLQDMLQDPRVDIRINDGRKFLQRTDRQFDLIEIDALDPEHAYSGNLFSKEFFDLISRHLKPNGIFAQYIPTERVENTLHAVFPHVIIFQSRFTTFALASNEPIILSHEDIEKRIESLNLHAAYNNGSDISLKEFFVATLPVELEIEDLDTYSADRFNSDLFPRDEYFINNEVVKRY